MLIKIKWTAWIHFNGTSQHHTKIQLKPIQYCGVQCVRQEIREQRFFFVVTAKFPGKANDFVDRDYLHERSG